MAERDKPKTKACEKCSKKSSFFLSLLYISCSISIPPAPFSRHAPTPVLCVFLETKSRSLVLERGRKSPRVTRLSKSGERENFLFPRPRPVSPARGLEEPFPSRPAVGEGNKLAPMRKRSASPQTGLSCSTVLYALP